MFTPKLRQREPQLQPDDGASGPAVLRGVSLKAFCIGGLAFIEY